MILRIGDNERNIKLDGTVTVRYSNGKTETIITKNTRFIYLNPQNVLSVTVSESESEN